MQNNVDAPAQEVKEIKLVQAVQVNVSKTVDQLTRAEKQELKDLSQEVFGASSRWVKLVEKGHSDLVAETVTELVPGEKEGDEGTTREVQVPLKNTKGQFQHVVKRYTVDGVREYMLARKKQIDEIKAAIKKSQDEQRAKLEQDKLSKKVHEELQGSAV